MAKELNKKEQEIIEHRGTFKKKLKIMSGPFKLKSGNTSSFKNLGSSPMHQEQHFLEKKPTIPMETHKGGDPDYKPELKSNKKTKTPKTNTKSVPNGSFINGIKNSIKNKKQKTESLKKRDVLQTVFIPQADLKKTIKVGKHYTKKAIKKGKELYNKTKNYLNSDL